MRRCLAPLGLVSALACGDTPRFDMPDEEVCLSRRDGQKYCIDTYEASRQDASETQAGFDDRGPPRSLPDRLPWTGITWEAARSACQRQNKRLCERDEWLDACDG